MRLKKEYIFLLLAIVALSVYLFARSDNETHFELPELAQVDGDRIDRLVVTKGERVVELQKKDDQWVVGPKAYKGDDIKVKNMVKSATDLKLTALVSESGSLERYGLSGDLKVKVQAYSGQELVRAFDIGRLAPTNQHTFVALADNPKVYHARGNIDVTYDHTVDELRDETVLTYEKSDISSLTLTRGEKDVTFTRNAAESAEQSEKGDDQTAQAPTPKSQWVDGGGNTADTANIERLINSFSNLRCDDYLEDDAKDSLQDPMWTVTLKSEQASHHLTLFSKEDGESIEFPAVSSGSPYAFILHKTRVANFEKEIDRLLKPGAKEEANKE